MTSTQQLTTALSYLPSPPCTQQQLALCAAVQLALVAAAVAVSKAVQNSQANNGWLDRFIQANVGFGPAKPKNHEVGLYKLNAVGPIA